MKTNNLLRLSVAAVLLSAVAACSSTKPHVGETSKSAELSNGVQVSTKDSRYLNEAGKLGGKESAEITVKATNVIVLAAKHLS